MNEQVMENVEVKKQPKERKPRKTKTVMNVVLELAGDSLVIFRELLKTFKDSISDELPIEIYTDKLLLRSMDPSRIKMANFTLQGNFFEEWSVANKTKYKPAKLPIRIKVPIADIIYAIEDAGKDAKARFDITAVFSTYGKPIEVNVRKPEKCPKCGGITTCNALPEGKRGKKGNRYKCGACGWRGKVRTWKRKERVVTTEILDETSITVEVTERTKETYKIKIFDEEVPEMPPIPIIQYNGHFKLIGEDFKAKLKRLHKRTDHFKIVGSRDGLVIEGQGDMIDASIKMDRGSDILLVADANGVQTAIFSLDQVLSILPKPSIAQIIDIEYSSDMPMKLTWRIDKSGVGCEYYVAPRIENDY